MYGGGLPGSTGAVADVLARPDADESTKAGLPAYGMPEEEARGRVAEYRWVRERGLGGVGGCERGGVERRVDEREEFDEGGDGELLFSATTGIGVSTARRTADGFWGRLPNMLEDVRLVREPR